MIKGLWHKLSFLAVNINSKETEIRQELIINKMLLFLIFGFLIGGLYNVILYFSTEIEMEKIFHKVISCINITVSGLGGILYIIKIKIDKGRAFLNFSAFFLANLTFLIQCILLGKGCNTDLLFYTAFIATGFIIREFNIKKLIFYNIVPIVFFILARLCYQFYEPMLITNKEFLYIVSGLPNTIGAGILIIIMTYTILKQTNNSDIIIEEERKKAEEQRMKSDNLLENILPKEIASELKEYGATKPIRYNSISVLFTDFVGFTQIAEKLNSDELINELDGCFSYFDDVTKKYNLEKIKTIGDSYMLVGGLPETNSTHPFDICLAALEIQAFMNQMKEIKDNQDLPFWELRLGINTGPLVAGVIGKMKFAYDVFGDTVNTASRMESSGVSGKINISLETYNEVKFLFDCEHRGKVFAKRKGDIDMFFVNGIKPKYSVNGEGRVPNDRFQEIYEKLAGGAKLVAKSSV